MTMAWIVLIVGLGAPIFVFVRSRQHRIDTAELGSVSQQWLAEQRNHDGDWSTR